MGRYTSVQIYGDQNTKVVSGYKEAPQGGSAGARPKIERVDNSTTGSCAGAGSEQFHLYLSARRREKDRLEQIDREDTIREQERLFAEKVAQNKRKAEERTQKNAEKRKKKKMKKLMHKKAKPEKSDSNADGDDDDDDEDDDEEKIGEREAGYSGGDEGAETDNSDGRRRAKKGRVDDADADVEDDDNSEGDSS
jgi:Protein of unknown function (DUF1168)